LLALAHFRADDRFAEVAERVVRTHASKVESNPLQHASLTLAADTHATGALELTLVADDVPESWMATLSERYLPDKLLAWRPGDDERFDQWLRTLQLGEPPAIWAERGLRDGQPTVYACRSFTCSPPRHDLSEALDWASENLRRGE
jgi:uncharacterized protein YyaL (SSP411 family)